MTCYLPVGDQDFETIRTMGGYYVDKTAIIHRMISRLGRACFLSRPRRFGKTLLCSTLQAIFEGRRDLFQEMEGRPALAIDSLPWEWKRHPAIRLNLSRGRFSAGVDALRATLVSQMRREG